MSSKGSFTTSDFTAGTGTLKQTANFAKIARQWGFETKCFEPDTAPTLQNWPAPIIPAAVPLKKSKDLECIGDQCKGRNVLYTTNGGAYNYIGPVLSLTASNEDPMVTFAQETLLDTSAKFSGFAGGAVLPSILWNKQNPWPSTDFGKTLLVPWSGCIDSTQCVRGQSAAPTPINQSISVTQTQGEVACIGQLCKGGSAPLIGETAAALVLQLFGDYVNGHAIVVHADPSGAKQVRVVAVSDLQFSAIIQPAGTDPVKPSATPVPVPFALNPCKSGNFEVGCYVLFPPTANGPLTTSLIVKISSDKYTFSGSPVLALIEDKRGQTSIAIAPDAGPAVSGMNWGTTSTLSNPCKPSTDAALNTALVEFCKPSVTIRSNYQYNDLPEVGCIGSLCENQFVKIRGSANNPGMSAQILGLFGSDNRGYALVVEETNQKSTAIWSIQDLKAAVFTDSLQTSAGPAVVTDCNGYGVCKCSGSVCVGGAILKTILHEIVVAKVTAVHTDGSIDWKPALSIASGSMEVAYNSRHWGSMKWQTSSPQIGCLNGISSGATDSFENNCPGGSRESGLLAETPCIGNLCEGQTLTSTIGKVYVMTLFGDEKTGSALVNVKTDQSSTFSIMEPSALLPWVPSTSK